MAELEIVDSCRRMERARGRLGMPSVYQRLGLAALRRSMVQTDSRLSNKAGPCSQL